MRSDLALGEMRVKTGPAFPGHTLNLGASFDTPGGWFGRLDLNATDAFYFDISHDQRSDRYTTVNLRLGRAWGPWALSAWVRNLTDEEYLTNGYNLPVLGSVTGSYGMPRTFIATRSRRYSARSTSI